MKLIIQIPCYNEAGTLAVTLAHLPRTVAGFEQVEWLVIDDGSSDATAAIAQAHGVDHVVRLRRHRGLARAFATGIEACLRRGADVIVNTDADNQYCAADLPELVGPILTEQADLVIGCRPIASIAHFSFTKKLLQGLGSWVVRLASGTAVADAPSGYRALSRRAAERLQVYGSYTYTLETLIQAGRQGLSVWSVPVRTNPQLRPSRLIRSLPQYLSKALYSIVRSHLIYRPGVTLAVPGLLCLLAALCSLLLLPFVTLSSVLVTVACLTLLGGGLLGGAAVAELIGVNRQLLERVNRRLRRLESRRAPRRSVRKPLTYPRQAA